MLSLPLPLSEGTAGELFLLFLPGTEPLELVKEA